MTASKRISAILLLSSLLLPACGSSGETESPVQQTAAAGTAAETAAETEPETTDYYAGIREAVDNTDLGGYNFNFISYDDNGYWQIYLYVEEENGDVLNDAAYRRNLEV